MTPPHRRWFVFSLRTLFLVITAVSMALAGMLYQLNWIRERGELRLIPGVSCVSFSGTDLDVRPPGMLGVFGEKGFTIVSLPPGDDTDISRAKELYPEATVGIQIVNGRSSDTIFEEEVARRAAARR